ncbi:MAG: hypothetical protein Q9183_005315 [Haloplaca sp. 2 TL-2023]
MADILFDDDDDDLWIEDPYAEADDLAEHTMHSPVLINYDPAIDFEDDITDWEYLTDEYYDEEPSRKRRKLEGSGAEPTGSMGKIKRKAEPSERIPRLSLGESLTSDEKIAPLLRPTVKWKNARDSPGVPTVKPEQDEKVSLLRDWQERFKPAPLQSRDSVNQRNGNQRVSAVVIENAAYNHVGLTDRRKKIISPPKDAGKTNGVGSNPSTKRNSRRLAPNPSDEGLSSPDEDTRRLPGPSESARKRKASDLVEPLPASIKVNGTPSKKRVRRSEDSNLNGLASRRTSHKRKVSTSPEPPLDPAVAAKAPKKRTAPADTGAASTSRLRGGTSAKQDQSSARGVVTSNDNLKGARHTALRSTKPRNQQIDPSNLPGQKRKRSAGSPDPEPVSKKTRSNPAGKIAETTTHGIKGVGKGGGVAKKDPRTTGKELTNAPKPTKPDDKANSKPPRTAKKASGATARTLRGSKK